MTFRTFWLKAHLYVGLTIGIVLFVVAVSGAALVFEDNIDRARHAALSYVTPGDRVLPLRDLTARVKAAYPTAQLGSISFPEKPHHSMQISARTKQDAISIYINEYTGQVLGDRSAAEREASLARRIHLLHTRLFAGQIGEWIVGVITFLTLFMATTGLILWWPRKIFSVKTRASWRRINFDLHHVFGLYASAVFLFIALTGMMISFEQVTDPLIARLNATPLPELPKQSTPVPGAAPMSADALTERAKAALPGAFLKGISIPNGGKGVIVALMKYPEDRTPGGRSRVYLDQYSGEALAVLNTRTAPLGTRILNLKRSAHTGDIFGAATQTLYFVTCLMLAGQIVTGFFIWWKRPANVAPAIFACLLAAASVANAQTRSAITGTAVDSSQALLPGVTITLTSPDLVGGAQTALTGHDGTYRFSDLPPGVYSVSAQLAGFRTVNRTELRLLFGTTLTVDFVLSVGNLTEQTVVVGRSPAVDVTTARSTSKIDAELIQATPTVTDQRNGLELMGMSPGVNLRSALGAARDANEVLLDGSPATAPERQATNAAVINSDWMEEIQVVAVGANAEYGEFSGAVVNFLLKSGSNQRHGLLEYRTVRPSWIGNNVSSLSSTLQQRFTNTTVLEQWDTDAQMGGPIVQDRMFYFGGFQKIRNDTIAAGAPLTPGPSTQSQWRVLGKLSTAPSNSLKVEGSIQSNKVSLETNGTGTATPETGAITSEPNTIVSTRATWTPNSKTLVEVRAGGLRYEQSIDPKSGGRTGPPPHRDTLSGISSVNLASYRFLHETRFGFGGSVTRYQDHVLGQSHELKAGVDFNRIGFYTESGFPGGLSFSDRGGAPDQVTIWPGDVISATGRRTTFFVQDGWRVTDRIRLEPGLRVTFNRGTTPTAGDVFSTTPIDPRFGAAWDVAKDHKTVVRAHYGRYHEAFGTTEYQFTDTATQTVQITARVNGPNNYTELTRLTPANNLLVDPNIAQAFMDQYMVGIEHELFTDFSLSAQYIQREGRDQFNWIDTKSVYAPVMVRDPGRDNVLGTADDGGSFTAYNLTNPGVGNRVFTNIGSRRYRALQLVAQKRFSKNWQILAGYTRGRAEGSVNNQITDNYGGTPANNPFLSPNNAINSVGRNTIDPPHEVIVRGSYHVNLIGGFNFGGSYRYISGNAMSRTAVFRLTQGNTTIRVEPRGTFPTEATNSADIRFDKTFPLGSHARRLSIYLDIFNVSNQGVATGAAAPNTEASGATYGVPVGWSAPRTYLLSGRFSF